MCGHTQVNVDIIPDFLIWLKYLGFILYSFSGALQVEFGVRIFYGVSTACLVSYQAIEKTLRQSFFLPFVSLLGSFAVVTQENVSQNTEENGEAEQHCSTFADTQFWCPQETQHHLAATINCIGSTASSQLNVHMNTFTDT